MKRNIILSLIFTLACVSLVWAAASTIPGHTELTAKPATDDLVLVEDITAPSTTKKQTVQNFVGQLTDSLLSATTVDLSADGNTTLLTVPAGKTCILTKAILVVGADAVSTDFTIGQAGALTDFLGTQQTDNLDAAGDAGIYMPIPNAVAVIGKAYAAGSVLKIAVANHAGGASNTLFLFGFLY